MSIELLKNHVYLAYLMKNQKEKNLEVVSSRIELETLSVLRTCDSQLHHETTLTRCCAANNIFILNSDCPQIISLILDIHVNPLYEFP
jgi:hypothetical protein